MRTGADDRVTFPIAIAAPLVDDRGPLLQRTIGATGWPREPTLAMIMPQTDDPATTMIVIRQPGINRLTRQLSRGILREFSPSTPGNLIRRPALAQPLLDILQILRPQQLTGLGPGLGAPFYSRLLGMHRAVQTLQAVAPQFPTYGRGIAAQTLADRLPTGMLSNQLGYDLALHRPKMTMGHGCDFVWARCFEHSLFKHPSNGL